MRLTNLRLNRFRDYLTADLSPCEGVTVLYGDNAQGKTALLEAIVLCCVGRSHRTARDREMVKWDEPGGSVRVKAQRADGAHEVEIRLFADKRKQVRVNGNPIARSAELMGHISGVLFAPEDLRLVKDGPAERRRFIDMELSQLQPAYYLALQEYARALQQRGRLLRDAALRPALAATLPEWDERLAVAGARIMTSRRAFVEKLARVAAERHGELSGGRERFELSYQPSCQTEAEGEALTEALRQALERSRKQDLQRLLTSVGPHRDDLYLALNGVDARAFGSQGQQRTLALSLKLSELQVMRDALGEWPLLMLDDVMSELDPSRRRQLLGCLKGVQTLVTCTDMNDLADAQIGMACRVQAGVITL